MKSTSPAPIAQLATVEPSPECWATLGRLSRGEMVSADEAAHVRDELARCWLAASPPDRSRMLGRTVQAVHAFTEKHPGALDAQPEVAQLVRATLGTMAADVQTDNDVEIGQLQERGRAKMLVDEMQARGLVKTAAEADLRRREVEAAERAAAALERQAAPFAVTVANDAIPSGPDYFSSNKRGPLPPGKSQSWTVRHLKTIPGAHKPAGQDGKPGRDWLISRADYERWQREQDTERCRTDARPEAEAIALSTLKRAGLRPTK